MTPATLIARAAAEGISLAISETGNIKAVGSGDVVQRWVPRSPFVPRAVKKLLWMEPRTDSTESTDGRQFQH